MLRRLPLLLVPALLSVSLAGCGEQEAPAEPTKERLDAVSITGEVGDEPTVTWSSQMSAGRIEAETLVTGDGPKVADGDQVLAHIWIGNGYTEDKAFSTHDKDSTAQLVSVDESLPPFLAAVKDATIGSRIAVTSSAEAAFGAAGNSQLGIGNKDSILVVVDLVSGLADAPTGTRPPAPAWVPKIEFGKGVPSGFDFTGTPAPIDELQQSVLFEGTGPVVEKGNAVVISYLGQTYVGDKPFDENFSTGEPLSTAIGNESVIKGWDEAIVGKKVGTRMIIAVPPRLGYGKDGNKDAGIKADDTLYFLIDIRATA